MSYAVIIPARLASTRLPGKVLKDIYGKPLIQWVYERSNISVGGDTYVVTPDVEIEEVVKGFGGRTVLTKPAPTVLACCSLATNKLWWYEKFIVVQGDEPTIYKKQVHKMSKLHDACMVKKITGLEAEDPNTVKAVLDKFSNFVYLSRSVIPGGSPELNYKDYKPYYYKQVCIMSFSKPTLMLYNKLRMNNLEKSEGIDLLRFIEHGIKIKAVETKYDTHAVDTEEDLFTVRELLK